MCLERVDVFLWCTEAIDAMQHASLRVASMIVAALVVSCLKPVVEVDADADFSDYETWAWLPWLEPLGTERRLRPELHELVTAQVERELRARGYRRAASALPDFFVTYHLEIQRQIVVRSETPAEEMLESFHQGGSYGVTKTRTHIVHYERGTLAIDVTEGHDRQLVWRGQLRERVRGSFDRHASDAVAEILEHFPRRLDAGR